MKLAGCRASLRLETRSRFYPVTSMHNSESLGSLLVKALRRAQSAARMFYVRAPFVVAILYECNKRSPQRDVLAGLQAVKTSADS